MSPNTVNSGGGNGPDGGWGNGPTAIHGAGGPFGPRGPNGAQLNHQRATAADTQALLSKSPMPEYWCSIQYYELDTQVQYIVQL